jgi:alpha-ketoglutarate-dependent taurine dioxygenase
MDMPLHTTVGLALLASLIALLITSLLFALRSSRRAAHLSPALRRLAKPVVLPQSQIVDGKHFPLTLSPVDANAGPAARIALADTFQQEILTLVRTHGAVLLRGWNQSSAPTAAHFSELIAMLELPVTAMECSAGPRFPVAPNVFTANEAPPAERIPFHHEMAQCDAPPSVVGFFCEVAATHGGATPLLHSHLAAAYLRKHHPAVAARLKAVGVTCTPLPNPAAQARRPTPAAPPVRHASYTRDPREIHARPTRDTREIHARYTRDTREIHASPTTRPTRLG